MMSKKENKYESLFQPLQIGGVTVKNRFFLSPMGNFGHVDAEGALTDEGIDYYVERAKGGIGLIITGYCIADEAIEEAETPSILVIKKNPLIFIQKCSQLTERVHAYGTKIFLQLTAGFGRTAKVVKVNKKIAPSDADNMYDPSIKHRAMTTQEVKDMIGSFGRAAQIAQKCGFDGVEIHALHEDYLLDQFTMEQWNHRTDQYGGSFENRYRVPCEIVQKIKEVCGKNFPVTLRYSVKHYMKDGKTGILPEQENTVHEAGRDLEEGLKAARWLQEAGYDGFDSDIGSCEAHYLSHPNIFTKDGIYLDMSAKLQAAVDVPVMVAGRMDEPDMALDAVKSGKCQMIGLGRPALADPYLVSKLEKNQPERIRHCISCNYGCITNIFNKSTVWCAINPQCYAERRNALRPILKKKKVVVVGGGPAGMEAALISVVRGHEVILYEKTDHLGGNLVYAGATLYKHHILELVEWFKTEMNNNGVQVVMKHEMTAGELEDQNADVVFIASGSKARPFHIPGTEKDHVFYAHEVYYDQEKLGDKVTVIGGGQIGMETAIWMAKLGKQVSVVEFTDQIMGGTKNTPIGDIEMAHLYTDYYDIHMYMNTKASKITENSVEIEGVKDGSKEEIPADTVLIAVGYEPVNDIYPEFVKNTSVPEVYNIGDSNHVANIYYAIHDAYELANNI